MASLTAIELGADTCAFARTTVRRGEVHLSAAEILDPAAFPGTDAFTAGVRQIRLSLRLPRHCRVVLWGLPDGATRKDAAVTPLLAPLTNAGFKVDGVVSPCNALAALARLKTSRFEGSTCWLAINRGGVAIVVVRPGKLIYAHSFAWDSTIGATGSQARLLQRYSLVSFLSPEVKRAMAEARKSGTPVYAVVTCGNLPDLRSLTMPLIEELDVEVETLDSFEGLVVKPPVAEKLLESASALRLACAAVIARGTRPWDPSKKRTGSIAVARYARAAVFAAVIAGVAYAWYARFAPATSPAPVVIATKLAPQPRAQIQTPIRPSAVGVPAKGTESNPPAVSVPAKEPESNPPAVSVPAKKPESNPPAPKTLPPPVVTTFKTPPVTPKAAPPVVAVAKPPVVSAPPPAASGQPASLPPKGGNYRDGTGTSAPALSDPAKKPESKGAVSVPAKKAESNPPPVSVPAKKPESNPPVTATTTVPRTPMLPLITLPRPNLPAPSVARTAPPATAPASRPVASVPDTRTPALNTPAIPADKPEAGAGAPRGPMPALLKDAVPRVTAILVSRDRRFATVDGGQIIGIGDLLGRRTVVSMDERSVLLQEPSGVQIRIGLGGRLLGVERAQR
jgi:hypothetical protein